MGSGTQTFIKIKKQVQDLHTYIGVIAFSTSSWNSSTKFIAGSHLRDVG